MKKWVLSALAYLIVVVGSYYAYTAIANPPQKTCSIQIQNCIMNRLQI